MSESLKKIYFSIPTYETLEPSVHLAASQIYKDRRYEVRHCCDKDSPIEHNRNKIALDFLKSDCDYLLMMDTDNPPVRNPLDLVEFDFDIVGCPTPIWHFLPNEKGRPPIYWNTFDWEPAPQKYRARTDPSECIGLQEVDGVGCGCILIARRVLSNPELRAPFLPGVDEDGLHIFGEDLRFCRRARLAGFRIFAHFDYCCDHYVKLSLIRVNQALFEAAETARSQILPDDIAAAIRDIKSHHEREALSCS